jgi:hypothetical protein
MRGAHFHGEHLGLQVYDAHSAPRSRHGHRGDTAATVLVYIQQREVNV